MVPRLDSALHRVVDQALLDDAKIGFGWQVLRGDLDQHGDAFIHRRDSMSSAIPSMMATSATLKMPVRSSPTPTFMKSTTAPRATRSTRFETPPANTRASPKRGRR